MASNRRYFPTIFSINWRTAASSVTSTVCPSNLEPFVPAALFKASNSSGARKVTTTLAPSSRNARVTARPNPPVPPATRITLPSNFASISAPLRSLSLAVQPFGHQESMVILVSGAPIEFQRRGVAVVDFQMKGVDAHFARFPLDRLHRLAAKSAAPARGVNVQF